MTDGGPTPVTAPTKVCPHCGAQAQTFDKRCPHCGKKYKRRTFLKVALGIVGGLLLLIGGCAALIGGAANEVDEQLRKGQNEHSIINSQAKAVSLGTTRREIEARFGRPEDIQEGESAGLGSDSCIYYNVRGGEILDTWQFCFQGAGKDGRLRGKNRY
jgi:hypothetical protein